MYPLPLIPIGRWPDDVNWNVGARQNLRFRGSGTEKGTQERDRHNGKMNCLKLEDLVTTQIGKYDSPSQSLNDGKKVTQKENLFMEPKRTSPKTPVKTQLTPSMVSWRKCCTPDRVQITPVKLTHKSSPEAWSPTANLKMLISAASPDIRDREKKKELFRQIENENIGSINNIIQLAAIDDSATDEFEQQRPSRKQKSLGLLCQKFLARYPNYPISTEKTEISLDEVAAELGVERRRIYDIVNILESLQLVSRLAKNQYSWHGLLGLRQTLATLKERGEQQRYAEQLSCIRHKVLDLSGQGMEKSAAARKTWASCPELSSETKSVEVESKSASMNSRKDKSLRIMSEKFVMLFLVSEPKTVALDIAAKILIEESHQDSADNSKFKTKIRRLYDIANVLTSLGLIRKVHVTEERGRKPAFQWVGPIHQNRPEGFLDHSIALLASASSAEAGFPVNTKERLECPASIQSSHANQRSPASFRKVRTIEAQDCSSKMVHLAAACRLQFEEDMKSSESPCNQEDHQSKSIRLASCPLLITSKASTVESPVIPLALDGFSVSQSELSPPFCLRNAAPGQPTPMPPPAAPNTEEGYSCPLKRQPFVFLQSLPTAPVLLLYKNTESSTEPSPGSSEAQPSPHEDASSLVPRDIEAAVPTRNSQKRSHTEQCTLPDGRWQDNKPEVKRGKFFCCLEHTSGSLPSVFSLSSMNQTLMSSGNLVPAPFVVHVPCGLAENSQSYCLAGAPGMRELNLLISSNQNLGGIAISPGQVASASRKDLPTKAEPPTLQSVTIKLQEQALISITPKDGEQSFVESYFHTPVPTVQGKKLEGLQIKASSPAQRRLEIENNMTK
ncbi:hypothetical protein scyTo_0011666 [Scyliorhinus torazame]|uniref:Transcription factor E2F7 n=1 Tax=Scyliorhinus torazame TaxID=75743 RepID=A0A401NS85_SCYTO|nr:hypothetical protein [Scyliorhinus torazame]